MENNPNYDKFLEIDFEKYKGRWIVICNEDIIASGDDVEKTLEEAKKKCPKKRLMVAKVPEEGTMIY